MSNSASGVWQKTLVYLGLWEEPEAEPYDDLRPEDVVAEQEPVQSSNVRPLRLADERDGGRNGAGSVVRLDGARTIIVEVTDVEDFAEIGGHHRDGQPVLFDLAGVDATTARRVLDMVAGMTYALHGQLSKLSSRAFLLLPRGTQLSSEERLRLEARGYRFADGA